MNHEHLFKQKAAHKAETVQHQGHEDGNNQSICCLRKKICWAKQNNYNNLN